MIVAWHQYYSLRKAQDYTYHDAAMEMLLAPAPLQYALNQILPFVTLYEERSDCLWNTINAHNVLGLLINHSGVENKLL